jgi:hypothetical protein
MGVALTRLRAATDISFLIHCRRFRGGGGDLTSAMHYSGPMRPTVQRLPIKRHKPALTIVRQPVQARMAFVRSVPVVVERRDLSSAMAASWQFGPDPHIDYRRELTPDGGIAITYKDIDDRLRQTLRRLFFWACATGAAGWYLFYRSPVHSPWINGAALVVAAIVNWLIVAKPVEVYRRIEIRPDCMIIDGTDVFWLHQMENGWPSLRPDGEKKFQLSGIYGTRFVDYVSAHRIDEFDRTPDILATHLQQAMQQLWGWSY